MVGFKNPLPAPYKKDGYNYLYSSLPIQAGWVGEWWALKTRYPPYKKDGYNLFFG